LDDDLPPGNKKSLEKHLRECPRCQKLLKELRAIREETRSLKRFTPPEELWEVIQQRLELRQSAQRRSYGWVIPLVTSLKRGWALRGVLIAGATVVAVLAILRFLPLWTPAEQRSYSLPPSLIAEVRQQLISARTPYLELIGELSRLAEAEMERWDPAIADAFRASLGGIDTSIKLCEEQMERFPLDPEMRGHLFNIYHEKLVLLEAIIEGGGGGWSI